MDELDQERKGLQSEVSQLLGLNKGLNEELQGLQEAQLGSANASGLLSRSTAANIQDILEQDGEDPVGRSSLSQQPNPPASRTALSASSAKASTSTSIPATAVPSTPVGAAASVTASGPLTSTPAYKQALSQAQEQPVRRPSAPGQGDLNAMSSFFAQLQS